MKSPEERPRHYSSDQLLTPELHPPGSRLLLSQESHPVDPYEVTVVEWAPSGKRVRLLSPLRSGARWVECWNYHPVVIESLPPLPFTIDGNFSPERFASHLAKSLQEFGRLGHYQDGGKMPLPQNATTLWGCIVEGLNRVADRLTAPPEK